MKSAFEGSYSGDASKLADDSRLECGICWWVYDPAVGDVVTQTPPGTPFAMLPDTWRCPNCDAEKSKFMVIGSAMAPIPPGSPVETVVNVYRRAAIAMKGLPIYNPTLTVEAVGFREHEGRQAGVIVTPWFMNLTVLPSAVDRSVWQQGGTVRLAFPSGQYDFLVSELEDLGPVATCSLFSPMQDFTDHEAAQLAAKAAADGLFTAEEPPEPQPEKTVSRRQLFGG